jgi:hypothetical protein
MKGTGMSTSPDSAPPNSTYEQWETVCATAHRNMPPGSEDWVRAQLHDVATRLRNLAGTRWAITGLARGGDLDWAEAALEAGLNVYGFIPFPGHHDRWSAADKQRLQALLERLGPQRVRVVGKLDPGLVGDARTKMIPRILHQRNDKMLDASNAVVAVWDPTRLDGGTFNAVGKAVRRGLPGVHIDPRARTVTGRLPAPAALKRTR